jgi:tRNA(fMet)-specific endonuclease VapC
MSYSLDTNTCIYHLNNSASTVTERLKTLSVEEVLISSMVIAELLYGAEKGTKRLANYENIAFFLSPYRIISFDQKAASIYAAIRADLERKGQIIGPNDIVIAATTLAHNAILVTNNTKEFSRIDGLKIEDWTKDNQCL